MSYVDPKDFLKGLEVRHFLDTPAEWHAFVEDLCEVLCCPWPARYQPSEELLNDLKGDHHYYMFGRAIGVIAWLIIAIIIKEVFF